MKRNSKGFTLIELLIVVAILGIIAGLAIPGLLRSRMTANEAASLGALKTMAAAETDYNNNTQPHTFTGSLTCLGSGNGAGSVPFLDPAMTRGLKSGYTFSLKAGASSGGSIWTWSATAWPVVYHSTGIRTFYIDETGVIRGQDIGGMVGTIALGAIE